MGFQILCPGLQMVWIWVSVVYTACGRSMLSVVLLEGFYQVGWQSYFMTSGVCLHARNYIGNAWDLLSVFLLSCQDDTRWCNTSKEIYIFNRCWSQTSCYGAARFVQSWVKFAYLCWPFQHRTCIFRGSVAECKAVVLMVAGLTPHFVFDSFLRILFRADVLHVSLCM